MPKLKKEPPEPDKDTRKSFSPQHKTSREEVGFRPDFRSDLRSNAYLSEQERDLEREDDRDTGWK